ncbi:MAG: hypothetical protein AAFY08_04185 [Planctomycetota bacterium]
MKGLDRLGLKLEKLEDVSKLGAAMDAVASGLKKKYRVKPHEWSLSSVIFAIASQNEDPDRDSLFSSAVNSAAQLEDLLGMLMYPGELADPMRRLADADTARQELLPFISELAANIMRSR